MGEGTVEPGFAAVREAFETNFAEHGELGASLAVYQDGHQVVDLWGGLADPGGRPWERDTLAVIASVTKSLAATAMLVLVDRGRIGLDDRVAQYWPEFAAEGKRDITLRMLMSHQAGVPSLAHSPMTYQGLVEGTPVMDAIASARPEWAPGTAHGYHGLTIGHAISALIQRLTGQTVGRFFADEIADPLGLDAFIGLPPSELPRLATMVLPDSAGVVRLGMNVPELRGLYERLNDPESLTFRALYGSMAMGWETANDPKYVTVEAPSTDGVANAEALAKMYAALIGPVDGTRLIGPETLDEARRVHASGMDMVLATTTTVALGFMLPGGPLFPDATGPAAFGHGGASGAFAFADPEAGIAFGYVPNRGSELLEGNDLRVSTLVAALYEAISRR
ncbi:serine hydrolase domain-containing protein [Kibdelosporangium aridum]|uniref:serine hydrolase domain-containing protein n=1 Tax=Kibdelosporangium aridum TaxID=2030 RepID=UPI00052779C0